MEKILEMNPSLVLRLRVPVEVQGEISKFVGRHTIDGIYLWKCFLFRLTRQTEEVVIPTVREGELDGRPTFVVTFVELSYLTVRTRGSRTFCAKKRDNGLILYKDDFPPMTAFECQRMLRNTALP